MKGVSRQSLLKQLAVASLSLGAGAVSVAPALAEVPAEVLTALVADAEAEGLEAGDRLGMLKVLVHDNRPAIRARVAEALGETFRALPDDSLELLGRLAADPSDVVHRAAVHGLVRAIGMAAPGFRVEIVCSWVTSANARVRAAVARALSESTPVLVTDIAIEQLALDADHEVRHLAALAAGAHYRELPTEYRRLLVGLSLDSDERVRLAAVDQLGS